ncbi:ATP phosphoribosyltransferase regulatory subunit [Catenibacillus scindens]|uniref:ATP phosphoribosyltransferase regulatory subunit n=1 Tax=Catenibacillus scindens TaxID=673271 RepID=A0A7W8H846_9FIRM|nr:ATP phosphoribosyltransferase regulatory subunit [Catenibacillus scindens]MBB5263569.1 ATP phosphoribosyltransferase regulatory subunit [Catenibacillus scindens]
MRDILLHTPEGVRDIYGIECARKVKLQEILSQVFGQYGYHTIQTPAFEFFDIFNGERGTVKSREMYKFFDREGNTLVLRPDITPSIARAVAKYYKDDQVPLRFTYLGNVFINNSSYQGLMKETTQMGAELIGADSAQADGEMIALAIELQMKAGLKKFVLDIGHAGFFRVLMEEAGLDKDSEDLLKSLIENKNFFGIESLIEEKNISRELRTVLMKLPDLSGSWEILDNVRELTSSKKARSVLDRLSSVYEVVKAYGYEEYVTFDLGMLTTYDYYTGIIFRGYTYGTGDAIVKGGRYDHLVGQFGKDSPAVGFALVVDQLLAALGRQKIQVPLNDQSALILYALPDFSQAVAMAKNLRGQNIQVTLMQKNDQLSEKEYMGYCRQNMIQSLITLQGGEKNVKEVG